MRCWPPRPVPLRFSNTMTEPTKCSYPGCTELHDDWPGPGRGDLLCQDHWETYSGALWWERVRALAELGNVQAEC